MPTCHSSSPTARTCGNACVMANVYHSLRDRHSALHPCHAVCCTGWQTPWAHAVCAGPSAGLVAARLSCARKCRASDATGDPDCLTVPAHARVPASSSSLVSLPSLPPSRLSPSRAGMCTTPSGRGGPRRHTNCTRRGNSVMRVMMAHACDGRAGRAQHQQQTHRVQREA